MKDAARLDLNPLVPVVRDLMREYAAQLGVDLCFQNFEAELAQLPGRYSQPQGCLVVAYMGTEPAGCVALRPLTADICEMKRLYIRPAFRGHALSRKLTQVLMDHARSAGYRAMRLDTLSTMRPAVALYESLGFQRIAPYYDNPIENSIFFELTLREDLSPSRPVHATCKVSSETDSPLASPSIPAH